MRHSRHPAVEAGDLPRVRWPHPIISRLADIPQTTEMGGADTPGRPVTAEEEGGLCPRCNVNDVVNLLELRVGFFAGAVRPRQLPLAVRAGAPDVTVGVEEEDVILAAGHLDDLWPLAPRKVDLVREGDQLRFVVAEHVPDIVPRNPSGAIRAPEHRYRPVTRDAWLQDAALLRRAGLDRADPVDWEVGWRAQVGSADRLLRRRSRRGGGPLWQ
mmetsp:Transcript_142352/g.442651  ORF Transcript_142352/g.442651 Transcript_142352/m.442651 type:complete len:214 (-) Transcript_142352:1261-1902(-)